MLKQDMCINMQCNKRTQWQHIANNTHLCDNNEEKRLGMSISRS